MEPQDGVEIVLTGGIVLHDDNYLPYGRFKFLAKKQAHFKTIDDLFDEIQYNYENRNWLLNEAPREVVSNGGDI